MFANEAALGRPTMLRDVQLRHLVALRAVAREHSFGAAARSLGFTQSAVSQQIAALEHIVGESLFERPGGPKPVRITAAGETLLRRAEAVLEELRRAEDDLADLRDGAAGRVSVGTFESVSVNILPEVIRFLRSERPGIEISLYESNEQLELLGKLEEGELDVTFVAAPMVDSGFEVEELYVDPFVVVSPIGRELGEDGAVAPSRLSRIQLIGQPLNSCQVMLEAGLRQKGVEPNIVFRSTDNTAVQAMVRSGMAHAVMPRLGVNLDDRDVVVERIDPEIPPRTIGLAFRPDRPWTRTIDMFLAVTRKVCSSLVSEMATSESALR